MHIIFFMQNNHAGGMDSFLINTINNWPSQKDKFTFICNKNHSGLSIIKSRIKKKINYFEHNLIISSEISEKYLFFFSYKIRRFIHPIIKIIMTPFHLASLRNIFLKYKADRLLVINGAYPGGETCRLANIAWYQVNKQLSIHNIRNFAIKPRSLFSFYENYLDKLLIRSTKSFIGVSRCCSESLRVRKNFKNIKNIKYIYNGVLIPKRNTEIKHHFDIRKNLNIENQKICLMLGTYEKRKGHEFLFNVFEKVHKKIPDLNLVICGDSKKEDRKYVEMIKSKYASRSKIHLLDYVNEGNILMNQADILVISSQEWESFGWTAIEGMARKIPVVSTNSGGLKEVIGANGVSGFSHDINDINGYAHSIIKILTDKKIKNKIIDNALKRVKNLFNQDDMINRYYNEIK